MKLPFALIVGKDLEDIAKEQLSGMTLPEAFDLAINTHNDNLSVSNYHNPIKPMKFGRLYGEITHPTGSSKKVKVIGEFKDLPKGLIDIDLEGTGPFRQNQLVLLDFVR